MKMLHRLCHSFLSPLLRLWMSGAASTLRQLGWNQRTDTIRHKRRACRTQLVKVLENSAKTFVKLRQCQCFCMTLHQGPFQGTGMCRAFETLMPTNQNHCKQVCCTYCTSQVVIACTLIFIYMPDRTNNIWIMKLGGSKRQTPRGLLVRSNEAVLYSRVNWAKSPIEWI